MYVVINTETKEVAVFKYLSKVGKYIGVESGTISKAFNRGNKLVVRGKYEVYKADKVDLKSFNKGNEGNFSGKLDGF